MCIRAKSCTELPPPGSWSTTAPLPVPEWIRKSIPSFERAVRLAAVGDVAASRDQLRDIPSAEIWEWGRVHGKQAGRFRYLALGKPPAPPTARGDGPRRPDSLARIVFPRDRYTCRYCGFPVIPARVLRAFAAAVGPQAFSFGARDRERTGLGLLMWAQLDHVVPYSRGGATSEGNVVTACWSCNYAKDQFTLEQLGLVQPRAVSLPPTAWLGLTDLLPRFEPAARSGMAALSSRGDR